MRITGASKMWTRPSRPISPKNSTMIGPKKVATFAVPKLCTVNSVIRITTVMGIT